ncbi:hypothetical protein ACFSJU_15190 [Paradesertivirga mongoliensis]|uniref:CcmD family protein n=1 Tax=Paradesertivirga mongoliensis TaxID=2100740 RepID=A0ABW4ZPK9_9SPHI
MRKLFLVLSLLVTNNWLLACPVCEKQQPKVLRGVTHGAGPQSDWDYVIVWVGVILVLCTLFYSLKWILRPGEKSINHIKQHILSAD